jgi:hypothetical protein
MMIEWKRDLYGRGQGAYIGLRKVGSVRPIWDSGVWEGKCLLPGPNIFSAMGSTKSEVMAHVEAMIVSWFSEIGAGDMIGVGEMSIIKVLKELYGVSFEAGTEVEAILKVDPSRDEITLRVASPVGGDDERFKWVSYAVDKENIFQVVCAVLRNSKPRIHERANDD